MCLKCATKSYSKGRRLLTPPVRTARVPSGIWVKSHFFQEGFSWPDQSKVLSLPTKYSDLLLNSRALPLALKTCLAWSLPCVSLQLYQKLLEGRDHIEYFFVVPKWCHMWFAFNKFLTGAMGGHREWGTRKNSSSSLTHPKALLEWALTHLTSLAPNNQSSDNSKSSRNKWNDLIKTIWQVVCQHCSKGLNSELLLSLNSTFHAL